jgi:hypothetical protein
LSLSYGKDVSLLKTSQISVIQEIAHITFVKEPDPWSMLITDQPTTPRPMADGSTSHASHPGDIVQP